MKIGEVGMQTHDVVRLSDFYKELLGVDNESNDEVHQTILADETMLTVHHDGTIKNSQNQNICLAFTVDDIDQYYEKVRDMGAEIIEPPTARPWGTVNMSFYDPDRNVVYLRRFIE
jgi:predicted enzyme related to lactoylglutathione lyase